MSEIIFDEDTELSHPFIPTAQAQSKGFENWFYTKFPGSYKFKRAILFGIALILFALTFYFIGLGRFNIQTEKLDFQDRTNQLYEE